MQYGTSLTDETLADCQAADAVLLGAVGGPKWDDPNAKDRPERGLLALRKGLGVFANLRPVQSASGLGRCLASETGTTSGCGYPCDP